MRSTQGMHVLSLSKLILLTSSYLFHLLHMTQPFHRYTQRLFRVDCTAGHQTAPNMSCKCHKMVAHFPSFSLLGSPGAHGWLPWDTSTGFPLANHFHFPEDSFFKPMKYLKYFTAVRFLIILSTKIRSFSFSIDTRSPSDEFWHNNLLSSQVRPLVEFSWNV